MARGARGAKKQDLRDSKCGRCRPVRSASAQGLAYRRVAARRHLRCRVLRTTGRRKSSRHVCAHRSSLQAPPYFSVLNLWGGTHGNLAPFFAPRMRTGGNGPFSGFCRNKRLSPLLPRYGRFNIVLESLAMGIPVVASRVGGIPEMAPEGQGARLCEPDDVEGFCAAIEGLASDPEGYLQLAAAGRRCAEEHHSFAGAAPQYATLFHKLMEERSSPAKSAEDEAAIATAMLPASRPYQSLPKGPLRASLCVIRTALSWSHMPGTMRTVWQYSVLRRNRTTAREFQEFFD